MPAPSVCVVESGGNVSHRRCDRLRRLLMTLADLLPTVNAALNATSALFLLFGWLTIRAGRRDVHQKLMLAACASSTLFLVSYLTRVALTGTHRFPGEGPLRLAYFVILGSHTLLAIATLPMAIRTLFLSLSG